MTTVFYALVILGIGAGGVGAINVYLDQSTVGNELQEKGVEADAHVMSATENDTYTEVRVSYDPPGPQILEFAEVKDCSGHRFEAGSDVLRVVYLPDDPEVIRLAACRSSFDSDTLPGILGVAMIGASLFLFWRLWRMRAG